MTVLISAVLLIVGYVAIVVIASRTQRPVFASVPLTGMPAGLKSGGDTLSVSTWNLGYAGLGKGSDFVADGGEHYLPPSREAVRNNLDGIEKVWSGLDTDISLFQEVSDSSPLSYWVPLDARLRDLNRDRLYLFQRDVTTRLVPWPLRLTHGLVVTSRLRARSAETVPLPSDAQPLMEIISRRYALQVLRLDADGGEEGKQSGWTVMNLHLSAFDDDGLRERQLTTVLDAAQREHAAGRRVVMGGDWNMELVPNRTRSPAHQKRLFWLRSFPHEKLPDGWRIAAPENIPTVRAVDRPYEPADTPVAIIDGFLISPNVEPISVKAVATGFEMSDHQPVIGQFRAK